MLLTVSTTMAAQHTHLYIGQRKVGFAWVEKDEDWQAQGSIPAVWLE